MQRHGRRQARRRDPERRKPEQRPSGRRKWEIMKKMLSEIKNRTELLEQLADLLAELDKYPSRVQRDVWALIDDAGKAEVADFSNYDGYGSPSNTADAAFICSKPGVCESLVESFYCNEGDFSDALGMKWDDFDKMVLQWIEEEEGGVDDDYEVTYDDCLEYAENHPEIYTKLEDIARDAIDCMCDVYKESAERYFLEALEKEKDDVLYA